MRKKKVGNEHVELAFEIIHTLQQHHTVGDITSVHEISRLIGQHVTETQRFIRAIDELFAMGYLEGTSNTACRIAAFDRATSCAVCGKYAPKPCPGCRYPFCAEHYAAHVEYNAEHLKGLEA